VLVVALAGCQDAAAPGAECGPGTELVGSECVAAPSCGAGTHLEGTTCVADGAHYTIQIAQLVIGADGRTRHQVVVAGTNADGSPATDDVVITAARGTLAETQLALAPLGTRTMFTSCAAADAGCLGPLTLGLALASDPGVQIAHVDVQLVAPFEVATVAPCRVGGNVWYIDGTPGFYPGTITFDEGFFNPIPTDASLMSMNAGAKDFLLGQNWGIRIATGSSAEPLAPGIYPDAVDTFNASPGHPGLDISGQGFDCRLVSRAFQIHEIGRAHV